jgi:hypothetical protein
MMALSRPHRRNCRQFVDGSYSEGGRGRYILHPEFAKHPDKYIRAFLLIQKDLQTLFDYVEPADGNLQTHSFRIHEMLVRTSIEVEANCKAILRENGYTRAGDWNMSDYKKINRSHRLSSFKAKVPYWTGQQDVREPFLNWRDDKALPWYSAYNNTKHDRFENFEVANFGHLIDAICGLAIILASQFMAEDFGPTDGSISLEGPDTGFEEAIGNYFRISYPNDWPDEEKYDFDWNTLEIESNPFRNIEFG